MPAEAGAPAAPAAVPLTRLRQGQTGVVRETRLDADDAALLRAMGLCVNMTVRALRVGEPCVVALGGLGPEHCACGGACRIGLARGLAERIYVSVTA